MGLGGITPPEIPTFQGTKAQLMRLLIAFLICVGIGICDQGFAQSTWSGQVAQIMYDNCTACHRPGGIGPFSLMTYESAAPEASNIGYAVSTSYMPPWTADLEYQSYAHERVLSTEELIAIQEWVNSGTPLGNANEVPPPPVYPSDGFIAAAPDVEVQIPLYTSQASNFADDYVCFSLPLNLATSKKLRAFEVIPGNPQIVHHALAYIDETGSYQSDLNGFCAGPTEGLIGGYTPGALPTVFPSDGANFNLGVTIPAGSNLVLAMHYPEGSAGQQDDTKIRLYFYDDEVQIREISTDPIIQNWNFNLPPEQITEVSAQFGFIPVDVSLLSTFPHMHLLGKSIESYAVTPDNDTLKFVRIPHWDFEWQEFYFFEQIQRVPAWSTIHARGSYDNTSNNPHNPNDPPQSVGAGLNTSDEMFLVYFHYLPYQTGDELLNLEELTNLPTFIRERERLVGEYISTWPNPFTDQLSISTELKQQSVISLAIYDSHGKLVASPFSRQVFPAGRFTYEWKEGSGLSAGSYFYSMMINGVPKSGLLIRK